MDPADRVGKAQAAGKIRVSHGGRHRGKPYSRAKVKPAEEADAKKKDDKTFISKVASYVVPQWLTGWFSRTKQEKEDVDESESESDDKSGDDDDDKEEPFTKKAKPSSQMLNHVNKTVKPRNMTSTPVVRNMPSFTILSSNEMDPQEGTSSNHKVVFTSNKKEDVALKKSSSKLLSVDICDEDNQESIGIQKKDETEKELNPVNKFTFSMGVKPTGAPRRFFAPKGNPSFKVSSFISSSPLIPCGSSSSFYPGRTSYGGASSFQGRNVKRQRMSPVASNVAMKKANIKPKPISKARGAVTSDTARKILGALERMSSPVRDAAKLTSSPSSILFNPLKKKTDYSFNVFAGRQTSGNQPPMSSLTSPRTVNVQFREKISEPFRFGTGDIRPSAPVSTFKSQGLPTSFSPDDEYKAGGKMKRQRQTSHYTAVNQTEDEEPVNTLPEIRKAAPLVVTSLPKINFGFGIVSKAELTEPTVSATSTARTFAISEKMPSAEFTFSQPDVISEGGSKSLFNAPKNDFMFSTPVIKETINVPSEKEDVPSKSNVIDLTIPEKEDVIKKSINSGKVSSIWNTKLNKWECNSCMLMNSNEAKICISCKTPKPGENASMIKPIPESKFSFANKFKVPEGSWECEVCMLMNADEQSECKSCGWKRNIGGKSEVANGKTSVIQLEKSKSLADKFKADENMWECGSCMLENKPELGSCAACGTERSQVTAAQTLKGSSSVFSKFAAPADSWECNACCLVNSGERTECKACGVKRPGKDTHSEPDKKISLLQAKFGASEGSWDCDSCMLNNKQDSYECVSCGAKKPGTKEVQKQATFSFGTSSSIKFGDSGSNGAIKFGTSVETGKTSGFVFGNAGSSVFNFGASSQSGGSSFGTSEKAPSVSFGTNDGKGFVFGNSQSGFKIGSGVGFSFGAPKEVKSSEPDASSSKTEENNNLSDEKALFASGADEAKKVTASSEEKETEQVGIKSIADAAKAGLLKVPEIDKKPMDDISKPSSGNSLVNGPTSISFSAPKSVIIDTNATEVSDAVASSSNTNSIISPFTFKSESPASKAQLPTLTSPFTFSAPSLSAPSLSAEQKTSTNVGFSFGSSNTFTFKATGQSAAGQSATEQSSQAQPAMNFNSTQTFAGFNSSSASKDVPGNFSFALPEKQSENQAKPPGLFRFSSEPAKPSAPLFGLDSGSNSLKKDDDKLTNSNQTSAPVFNSFEPQSNTNVLGASLFQNVNAPPVNMFGSSNNKFSFGSNSKDVSSIFGNTQSENANIKSPPIGFNFSSTPITNSGENPSNAFKSSSDKPFSFTAPIKTSNPFGNALFNNATGASSTGEGFNFGSGTNTTPLFSSGAGPTAPSNRAIKRAVRRKKAA